MNKGFILLALCVASIPSTFAFADVGSIIQTAEGTESDVKGSLTDVNSRVVNVLKQEGIQTTAVNTENSGSKQTIQGKKNDMDVQIQLTQNPSNLTHVIVTAKQGTLKWNKDFAQEILTKIVQSS